MAKPLLQNMRALQPAVVLMDMNLPVKDGWSACEEAARDASIKHIPIIALTAHAMAEDKHRAGSRVLRLCHQTG